MGFDGEDFADGVGKIGYRVMFAKGLVDIFT